MPEWPEHDRLMRRKPEHSAITEFLEWLNSKDLWVTDSIGDLAHEDELLGEYFGIDLKKFEQEKVAMLARLRESDQQELGETSDGTTEIPAKDSAG